jgi:hypothetical protein
LQSRRQPQHSFRILGRLALIGLCVLFTLGCGARTGFESGPDASDQGADSGAAFPLNLDGGVCIASCSQIHACSSACSNDLNSMEAVYTTILGRWRMCTPWPQFAGYDVPIAPADAFGIEFDPGLDAGELSYWTGTVHYLVDGPAGPEAGSDPQYTTSWILEGASLFIGMYGVQGLDHSSCPDVLYITFSNPGTWSPMVRLP